MRRPGFGAWTGVALALAVGTLPAAELRAQDAEPSSAGRPELTLRVEPDSLELSPGDEADLRATLVDAGGETVERPVFFFSTDRRALEVDSTGHVVAHEGGEYGILVVAFDDEGGFSERSPQMQVRVGVSFPAVTRLEFTGLPERSYAGATYRVAVRALTGDGQVRDDLDPSYRSSDPRVAEVGPGGRLLTHAAGTTTLTAEAEGVSASRDLEVLENPIRSIELSVDRREARTGDVVHATAVARGAGGEALPDVPVSFSVQADPIDTLLAPPASAQVDGEGRFVAEKPGAYTIVATSGGVSGRAAVHIEARDVDRRVRLVGHGAVGDVHTSDLWVWEGVDGRDYAVTGTWGADGTAYFWDVTDPARIVKIDSVQVDARTVNDVKVSEDGRIAVISREGASDRRNGIVILDVSDPHSVSVLSEFDDGLTGGVHNVFIHEDHVYAVNNGRRYDIISIEDPRDPHRVGRFELDTPGHALHDVWVVDGIAYSSNWDDGVVLVDVGNGVAGGSPSNPVKIGQYAYPSGANHAAFPYWNEETGRFYVIAGDEIMPGFSPDEPGRTAGYIHFIDFTDRDDPREVARYQVPEAGTHNLWVEGDRLYVAYYNGGLRVVDISGELKGDLYRQGREVASYLAYDPDGKVANAPMAWGPQPHKGHIFFSDFNSGLWAVKLVPERELVP